MKYKTTSIARRTMAMNRRKTRTSDNNISCGLSLSGTVIDRTRRMVPRDNPTIEIVTYTVQDSCSRKYYVDDFAPSEYHDINSSICFPVYIKAYRRKNGEPSYTINVQKKRSRKGRTFLIHHFSGYEYILKQEVFVALFFFIPTFISDSQTLHCV